MFYKYVVQLCLTNIVNAHAWVDKGNNRVHSADTVQVYVTICRAGEVCASCMSEECGGIAYKQ